MNDHRNGPRRRHSTEFKTEVVSACGEPGASVAAVALAFGLNANLVRQWLHGPGFKRTGDAVVLPEAATRPQRFVPLALPAAAAAKPEPATSAGDIRVEVRRGTLQVHVSWPQSAGADCAAWLRELLR
jgi:transposase